MVCIRNKKQKNKSRRVFAFVVLLLILIIVFLELRLKPIAEEIATIQAESLANEIMNESVSEVPDEMKLSADELESISTGENNTVTSINTNTVNANRFKSRLTLHIEKKLSEVKGRAVNIPVGTLIGGNIFNGMGPSVTIGVTLSGTVKSNFNSSFKTGGVNQTVHCLSVVLCSDVNVLMPLSSTGTTVKTEVPLTENLIVGNVPSGMIMK